MFCKHEFIKDKNNLYCKKCGKYVRMKCDHQWEEIDREIVKNIYRPSSNGQTVSNRQCKICGKLIQFNLTTGQMED